MMRIIAADGLLPFGKHTVADPVFTGSVELAGVDTWIAVTADGQFSYQLLNHPGFTLIKYSFQAVQDCTLIMELDKPCVGTRVMLTQHLFHRISDQRFYLLQGQSALLEKPQTSIEIQLQQQRHYEFLDVLIAVQQQTAASFPTVPAPLSKPLAESAVLLPDFFNYQAHDTLQRVLASPRNTLQVFQLLQELSLTNIRKRQRRPVTEHQLERLFSIKQLISQQVTDNVHLHHWAAHSGMNITYFKELFKYVFGITPYRYLLFERISAAKKLIQAHPQMPLAEVAMACGFSDYNNLRRAFVTVENVTLSEWKKLAGLTSVWFLMLAADIL